MPTKAELERTVDGQKGRIAALEAERDNHVRDNQQTGDLLQVKETERARLEKEVEKLQAELKELKSDCRVFKSNEDYHKTTVALLILKSFALEQSVKSVKALQKVVAAVSALDRDSF